MSTEKDIIASLRKKSVSSGWDFVVAYNREKINQIFLQQYIEKTFNKEEYSFEDMTSTFGLEMRDIKIGPPLISFENSNISSSKVIVRRRIISGVLIQIDGGQVVRWVNISPSNDYAFLMTIDLEYGSGTVTDEQDVYINFSKGYLTDIEGLGDLPSDLLEKFRSFFSENSNKYLLGKIAGNISDGSIYPKQFIVRTQPAPGATLRNMSNYGDGAVLLFIATNLNPYPGHPPKSDYPYLLADGRSATLILGSSTLYQNIFAENFKKSVSDAKFQYIESDNSNASKLMFTSGFIESDSVITGEYNSPGVLYYTNAKFKSSDNSGGSAKARLQMYNFSMESDINDSSATTLTGSFVNNITFYQDFHSKYRVHHSAGISDGQQVKPYPFDRHGKFSAKIFLEKNNIIAFERKNDLHLESKAIDNNYLPIIPDDPTEKMVEEFNQKLNQETFLQIPSINTFYVQHILFPDQDVLTFDKVAIPNDIIMFGDIKNSVINLSITPTESLLVAGKSVQLTTSSVSSVTWSIDPPNLGSISKSGLYSAPPAGDIDSAQQVKVIAQTTSGSSGSALITVVPRPIELNPSILVIKQGKALPYYEFVASITDSRYTVADVTWRIGSDYPRNTGTISENGIYTPPETYLEEQYVFSAIIAKLPDGSEITSPIVLIGQNVVDEFQVNPPYAYALEASQTAEFKASSRDFYADDWSLFPVLGTVTYEEKTEGAKLVTTGTYLAPDLVHNRVQAIISVTRREGTYRASHVIVDLRTNNASRK